MSVPTLIDQSGLTHLLTILKGAINGKVDKVENKGLSTNDFTNQHKQTLDKIVSGQDVTVSAGTLFINRTVTGGGT